jgi:putative NADH-flavin reductase
VYIGLENHADFSQGDIYHHDSLVKAIKQVDIVISAVGSQQIADQVKIINCCHQRSWKYQGKSYIVLNNLIYSFMVFNS